MKRYRVGLIGNPVDHSRSPAMHNAAFASLEIAAHYERWQTTDAELPGRIRLLRAPDVLGANVTLPHKMAVLRLLDTVETIATQIGAVNTIYKQPDGTLVGTNTDAPALLDDLYAAAGFVPAGQAVVLLGASGAARAAAYALVHAGVERLVVANRTVERAEELLSDILENLGGWQPDPDDQTATPVGSSNNAAPPAVPGLQPAGHEPQLLALALTDPDLGAYIAESTLLVNATSLGWHADETPLPDPPVAAGTLVYDMVYRPTRLLRETSARGAQTLDGLGMLLRQGALAFTHWTGQPAPLDVMRTALQTA